MLFNERLTLYEIPKFSLIFVLVSLKKKSECRQHLIVRI